MTCSRGGVVLAAFPHIERRRWVKRPALVVSERPVFEGRLFWALMITDEANAPWPLDVGFGAAWAGCGLLQPSCVRVEKVTVLESTNAQVVGVAPPAVMAEVDANLRSLLALP